MMIETQYEQVRDAQMKLPGISRECGSCGSYGTPQEPTEATQDCPLGLCMGLANFKAALAESLSDPLDFSGVFTPRHSEREMRGLQQDIEDYRDYEAGFEVNR